MKGLLLAGLLLVGLDLILQAPAARVLGGLTPITNALDKWMDPTVPLLAERSSPAPAPAPKRANRRTPPPPTSRQRP